MDNLVKTQTAFGLDSAIMRFDDWDDVFNYREYIDSSSGSSSPSSGSGNGLGGCLLGLLVIVAISVLISYI